MSDLRELLRQHGAPAPVAMAMPGETRSDDGLFFEYISARIEPTPEISTIAEWTCVLEWKQIEKLQAFLKADYGSTNRKPEVLFDDVMKFLDIGSYIGTYLGKHFGGSEVRMLFHYAPNTPKSIEDIYRQWGGFLTNTPPGWTDAANAVRELRKFWLSGQERSQSGLMMLAGVDLAGRLADASRFPFASVDRS